VWYTIRYMRPRVFIDIRARKRPVRLEPVLRLDKDGEGRTVTIRVSSLLKTLFVAGALAIFFVGFAAAPTSRVSVAAQDAEVQRKQLEAQLAELEGQISQYESKISEYSKQGKTLQGEIKKLESQIAKLNLQIKAINLSLSKLDQEITVTQKNIKSAEESLAADRVRLSSILQNLNAADHQGLIEVLLRNPQLSDFIADVNNLLVIQESIRDVIRQITVKRQELMDQKEILALEREDAAALKAYQAAQAAVIARTQSEKSTLLKATKGKESEYQKLLTESKKTAAQIRQQIFKLLGGGELSFGEAYKLARFAEQATGVRAALVLAVLDRESALGKNVGRCSYKTAMHPRRDIPVFLQITQELGMNPESTLVSCANSDGAYGGAMGPAQFIPSTWAIYKDRIAAMTGNNPPNPWKHTDAFMATALYIKDAKEGCDDVYSRQTDVERCAAAKYYAGARWRSYLWTYGERVVAHAKSFQDDIDVLGSTASVPSS